MQILKLLAYESANKYWNRVNISLFMTKWITHTKKWQQCAVSGSENIKDKQKQGRQIKQDLRHDEHIFFFK